MVTKQQTITAARKAFGKQLAGLRGAANLTQAELGGLVGYSRSSVANIEAGYQPASPGFCRKCDEVLSSDGALRAALDEMEELVRELHRQAAVSAQHDRRAQIQAWKHEHETTQNPAGDVADHSSAPDDSDDQERLALAADHPRRVDDATVRALAGVLAANRRLEDVAGSAAVLPAIRHQLALARDFLADARLPVRNRIGALTGELHQYLGWLLVETGHPEQARAELDAALAIGVELDDPNLTSLALSYKGHLAWIRRDAHGVIALSGAAGRDERVFVTQHAFNAYQQARGWAMTGDVAEMDRLLGRATELADAALAQQADAPGNMYWYGAGFFTMQRGLTWHMLRDSRYAPRAAAELSSGLGQLPDAERDSEWAADFALAAAEAYADAGDPEQAVDAVRRVLAVCQATRSTQLSARCAGVYASLREGWPTVVAVRELGDEVRTLSRPR